MKIEYWNMKGWESVPKLTRVENWLGNNDEDIFDDLLRQTKSLDIVTVVTTNLSLRVTKLNTLNGTTH